MTRMIVAACAVAAMTIPGVAAAQDLHSEKSRKADLHVSSEVFVGTQALKPGDYTFQCKLIDGKHYLVVETSEGQAVARVPCEPETLSSKVELSEFRSVTHDGKQYVSAVRIRGEAIAHRVAAPGA